jgi:copper chaperone CopZ
VILLCALPILGAACRSPKRAWNPTIARDREACTLGVSLPNMACSDVCPMKVRGALARVKGVRAVDVDFESRSAVVDAVYPACSEAGYEQMVERLGELGYQAYIVSAR